MSENVTNEWKQTKKTTVGFKVITHKHNYLSNMQIFSATDNIRSKYKRIQATLRTTSFVCFGNATYAWYTISTLCRHSIHNKKRDKVTLY